MPHKFLNTDGLMIDPLILVLMFDRPQTITTYQAVQLTEFIIADEIERYVMGLAFFGCNFLHC